jgi:YQGE family putative transporter
MRKNFLIASWLFGLGNSFSSPIIGLYIYINSSINYMLKFLLISSIFILLGYILVGYLTTFWKEALTYYKLGILLFISFYILMFILNVESYRFISFLGILYGLAQGFYWSGWDIIFYNIPHKLKFFNKSAYLGFFTNLVSPAVYGSILTIFHNNGYGIIFLLTALTLLLSAILAENVKVSSFKFNIRRSISVFNENKTYRYTMTALAIVSGVNYILTNVNTIIIYKIATDYLNFAIISYSMSVITLISIYVIRDKLSGILKPYNVVLSSSLLLGISSVSIIVGFPLFYLIVFSLTSPLIYPIIDVYNWNNMDRRFLTEYLVNRQIFLNSGRILSSLSEVILSQISGYEILPLIPLIIIASIIFVRYNSKEKIQQDVL